MATKSWPLPDVDILPPFVAVDFETADTLPDSACAIGLVRMEGGQIVARATRLIRPPRPRVQFTEIHGITWAMVRSEPTFAEVWQQVGSIIDGVECLVAHNAAFDRRVLHACLDAAGLERPAQAFRCTVQIARKAWSLPSNRLDAVARHLGIRLQHHEAGSDAEAAARIYVAAHAVSRQR